MSRFLHQGLTEQSKAAVHRLADARVLQEQQRWRGAMYMAGYAIECRLKALLMEMHRCRTLEELEQKLKKKHGDEQVKLTSHNIEQLMGLTGASERIHQNTEIRRAYFCCVNWTTAWRYAPDEGRQDDCESFLEAVRLLSGFLMSSI